MRFQVHSVLATCLLWSGWPVLAQTAVDLTRQGKIESGAQLPAQCSQGQLFVQSGTPSGPVLYICSQPNVWSTPGDFVAGAGISIAGASITTDDAIIPVYSTGTGSPSQNCTAGRDFYLDLAATVLYYCRASGQWQGLSPSGHTHSAADITSGTLSASLFPAVVVLNNQANTYSAGMRQSVTHDNNNAGLRLIPGSGDPANAQDGDLWYHQTTGRFRRRENGAVVDWSSASASHSLLSSTHSDTTPASVVRGDVITGQGTSAAWTRLALGSAGSYLRSNGTDLTYGPITVSDLPGNLRARPIGFAFSGTSLVNGATAYVTVPFACTISAYNVTADTGTVTFDVWKTSTGAALPSAANSIVASAPPSLSTGTAIHSTALTGWTTAVSANDIFAFKVTTVSGATVASLVLECDQ